MVEELQELTGMAPLLATYPLRYYLVIIRGVFLKGVGADILWPNMLGFFLIGAIILLFAVQRFHKTVA